MHKQAHLVLGSQIKELDRVLDWFQEVGANALSEAASYQCQLLLSEGFSNAVVHAHQGKPSDTPIEIQIRLSDDRVEILIWDRGEGFDLLDRLRMLSERGISSCEVGGRGLLILSTLTSRIDYQSCQDGRNCLHLVKDL